MPSAIVCDVTAFGSSGPLAGKPATDAEIQAMAGVMDATGVPDGPPMALAPPLIEQLAGVYAAAGVLAALRQRRESGAAPPIEIALYDVAFSAMTSFLAPALFEPERDQPSRVGNRHTMAAPWNVYRAQDGWVLLCAGNDDQWAKLCALIGQQEQGRFPHLARNADGLVHADEVDALVQAWIQQRSIAQCVARLSTLDVPCGPVTPLDGFARDANLEHRGMILQAETPKGRGIALPASALRMSASPGISLLRVPARDADRAAIVAASRGRASPAPAKPAATAGGRLPLAGLRVIEIGHYTTAPVATRLLAALGAELIKVEPPEGMMAVTRIGDMPLKTGPSLADVIGAAFGMVAILGALQHRESSGLGQAIDLSMLDICAWATQTGWNGAATAVPGTEVVRRGERFFLHVPGSQDVPVMSTREVVRQPQTQAPGSGPGRPPTIPNTPCWPVRSGSAAGLRCRGRDPRSGTTTKAFFENSHE